MSLIFLCPAHALNNKIQLSSSVINGYLVPEIRINGVTVMRIRDRGPRNQYESAFDRAEYIQQILSDLDQKGIDIGLIRVRRYKSEYSAHIKRTLIFKITPGDILAYNSTGYNLAKQWVDTIRSAVNVSASDESLIGATLPIETPVAEQHKDMFPLVFLLNSLSQKGGFLLALQILFLGTIQLLVAYGVVVYITKKRQLQIRAIHSRVDKIQNQLKLTQQSINDLHQDMKTLKKRTEKKPISISKKIS